MDRDSEPGLPLLGWTIIGLRARAQQAPLRRAARRLGAAFVGLSGLELQPAVDPLQALADLQQALACPVCIFSSPAAVRFAARLVDLRQSDAQLIAVGAGSALALRRAGGARVLAPHSLMRSEGVLALPPLSPPPPCVGLVSAPGGRGEIQRQLQARGCELRVAEVYRREAAALSSIAKRKLGAVTGTCAVLLSSAEALLAVLDQLDQSQRQDLLKSVAVCASPRLLALAASVGFERCLDAGSTDVRKQLTALRFHAESGAFR